MTAGPCPSGYSSNEEWILHQLYQNPNSPFSTENLFQQLEQILKDAPSRLDTVNALRAASQLPPLSAEEHSAEQGITFSDVQWAVETLIEAGWADGKLDGGGMSVVYYTGLKITKAGRAEAIREMRKRTQAADALATASECAAVIEMIRGKEK